MAATKKIDYINEAYVELRISGFTVQPTPEDRALALKKLENMAAEWAAKGVCTEYNFTENPDPDDLTHTDKEDDQAFITNLAKKLIPPFNKKVPQELIDQAKQTLSALSARSAKKLIKQVQYPERMATGSGNTQRYRPYNRYYRDAANPPSECSTNFLYIGDIDNYREDYTSYLNDGEVIDSYTIDVDPGLRLISDANNTPFIDYTVEGENAETSGNWQQVKIVITTDAGRVLTRLINFEVQKPDTVGSIGP